MHGVRTRVPGGVLRGLLAWGLGAASGALAQPGKIDPGFSVPGLRSTTALGNMADGRVVLAGNFTNAPAGSGVAILALDGTVAWRSDAQVFPLQLVAAGAGGEVYAGGDNRAWRFRPPATAADATFVAGNGWRTTDPWGMAVAPDGGLLIAGAGAGGTQLDWQNERFLRNLPVRIAPNGTRDAAFGDRVGAGPCTDFAVAPDGTFLAARTTIQRFLADGTLDAGFAPWTAANVELLRRLPSGDYLIGGGAFNSFRGAPAKSLIRVGADGVRDATFDYAGTFDVLFDSTGAHRALAVLADGRLVVGQAGGGIRRFLANGALDPSWTDPAPTGVARELVCDARGQTYVMGSLEGTASRPLYRLAGDDSGPVDEAPSFATQPAAATAVTAGGSFTLTVVVNGQPAPVLQWWFDGQPLAGETGATLEVDGFQAARAGAYQVVASNRVSVVRSTVAAVHVNPGAARPGSPDVTFEAPPLNPAAGVAGFVSSIANPLFWGGAPTSEGGVYLWGNFNFRHADGALHTGVVRLDREGGADAGFRPVDTVRDAGGGVLEPEGRLVLGAVHVWDGALRDGVVRLNADGTVDGAFDAGRLFDGTVQAAARIVVRQGDGGLLLAGGFSRVAGVARPGLARLRPDGALDTAFAVLPPSTRVSGLALAPDGDIYAGGTFSLPGATEVVSLIRLNPDGTRDVDFVPLKTIGGLVGLEALPGGGVVGLTAGVAQTAPRVLASLFRLGADGTVDAGFESGLPNRIGEALLRRGDGSFLVAGDPASAPGTGSVARHLAGGTQDPFYTNAPLVHAVRAVLPADGGGAWLITAAHPGAVRLRGDDYVPPVPPVIVRQPRSMAASGATAASFRVVADGVRPLTYQWRKGGVALAGATADTLVIAPLTEASLGTYDVVVTGGGGGGSTTSAVATLGNDFPPEITVQPLFRTNVLVGATVTLAVEARGTAPLAYQWLFQGQVLPGATSSTLVLANLRLDQQGVYTVAVSNTAGTVLSREAEVKVGELPVAPSMTRQPEDQVAIAGVTRFCFQPGVAGTGPLGFQWQRDGVDLPGSVTVSLCLGPLTAADAGRYRLVVTNAQGRVESREALVTVVDPVFAITDPPAGLNLVPGRAVVFTVGVRNDAGRPLTYRWQRDGVDIPGATEASLRLDPPTTEDAGRRFRVVVSDGVTTLTSAEALATANPEAILCPGPAVSIYRVRGTPLPVEFGVDAHGFGTLTYQWRRGPAQVGQVAPLAAFVAVPGATSSTLRLAVPGEGDIGDYFCEVRSEFGSSVVDIATQAVAMRLRLVDEDTRPGRVDFGWDYLALGEVWALNGVDFLPDARVYVAGAFGNPLVGCVPLRVLARLLPDGRLDPTFAPVTAAFGTAVGLVRQPSGKLVIAGDFRGVPGVPDAGPNRGPGWVRLHADGTVDASFVTTERGFDGSGGIQIAGQSDGGILVLRQGAVTRLLPDGEVDAGFGVPLPGSQGFGIASVGGIRRLLVDAQDRILLLTANAVRRYLPRGVPDPAWATVNVPENLVRMAAGPDGRVVATGHAPDGSTDGGLLRVVRFLADGTREAAFQPEYPAGGTIPGAPGVQPDGRVVIGGTAGTFSARLAVDGTRDATWEPMATPGGLTAPAFDPYWFFGPDGRALIAAFAFDDGIGFSTPGQRHLHRLQNGGAAFGQVRLDAPRFVDGRIEFSIPTVAGRRYEVQFLGALGATGGVAGNWSGVQVIQGDGTAKTVALGTTGTVGFYRIVVTP